MAWADRLVGLLLIASCIPLWRMADRFPQMGGTFPKTVLAAIVALAVILIARSFVARSLPGGEGRNDARVWGMAALVGAASIGSGLAMDVAGYFPAMLALSGALFFVLAGQRRLLYLGAVTSTLGAIFIVFVMLLGVPLTSTMF